MFESYDSSGCKKLFDERYSRFFTYPGTEYRVLAVESLYELVNSFVYCRKRFLRRGFRWIHGEIALLLTGFTVHYTTTYDVRTGRFISAVSDDGVFYVAITENRDAALFKVDPSVASVLPLGFEPPRPHSNIYIDISKKNRLVKAVEAADLLFADLYDRAVFGAVRRSYEVMVSLALLIDDRWYSGVVAADKLMFHAVESLAERERKSGDEIVVWSEFRDGDALKRFVAEVVEIYSAARAVNEALSR